MMKTISDIKVGLRGGGDLASGIAWRLYQSGFKVFITEIAKPLAVRRKVAFCEAVYDGRAEVEGVEAVLIPKAEDVYSIWGQGKIPLLVDPQCEARRVIEPHVIVDAILAKKNLGTTMHDAPLVIALGPGFEAGKDAHFVVETNRGHNLGRLIASGTAEPNTGVPGSVQGITAERVLRAPVEGKWQNILDIGDKVKKGDVVGSVNSVPVEAQIAGVIRGLLRSGTTVTEGLKLGDIDPRGNKEFCYTISEKSRALGGTVLEGILRVYGR
ncbi:MAG: selenium-dependent molybdenum cofactor biosynthesis protein YqeB [Desulfobacteraceae bacterium]